MRYSNTQKGLLNGAQTESCEKKSPSLTARDRQMLMSLRGPLSRRENEQTLREEGNHIGGLCVQAMPLSNLVVEFLIKLTLKNHGILGSFKYKAISVDVGLGFLEYVKQIGSNQLKAAWLSYFQHNQTCENLSLVLVGF